MPSFDIVSKVEAQDLENAINNLKREVQNRYDFRDSATEIEFNKKENTIEIVTENELRMQQIVDMLIGRLVKQKIDPRSADTGQSHYASGKMVRKIVKIRQGIEKDFAKKIVKLIKDTGLKVQPTIMDDQVRVTAKQIDDLQSVIQHLRKQELELPLQFVNMKS
jgi:uncharacterized protein YajQ (UPF0234 family)